MTEHWATEELPALTWDESCDLGAAELEDPIDNIGRLLRAAGISRARANRLQTIEPSEEYL